MPYDADHPRLSRLALWIVGALLILTAAAVVDGIDEQVRDLIGTIRNIFVALSWISPLLAASLAAFAFIQKCNDETRLYRIGLAIILSSLICRVIWISVFDSYQVNDFGFYLHLGADAAVTTNPAKSDFYIWLYWKRAAFYTYPIAVLFGRSLLALKIANVLLATITTFVFFRVGIALFGVRLAAVSLLFFIWLPDLWYAMTLASPDFPGMLWLSVFFYLCVVLQRRLLGLGGRGLPWVRLAVVSLFLGAGIFFLDFTRTYHYVALVALFCYVVLETVLIFLAGPESNSDIARFLGTRFRRGFSLSGRLRSVAALAVLWLALPFGTYLLLDKAFFMIWKVPFDEYDTALVCELTTMEVLGFSSYGEIKDWSEIQCPNVDYKDQTSYAIRKLLHDVTHNPAELFRHLRRKNRELSRADDYLQWSTYATPESWDSTKKQVRRLNWRYFKQEGLVIALAHALVLLLVFYRLSIYPLVPFRRQEWIALLFSGLFYALILFLLECQPRYDIFLGFVFSWMAGQGLDDLYRRFFVKTRVPRAIPSRLGLYAGGALLLTAAIGIYSGASLAIRDSYLTLRDQSGFTAVGPDQLPRELSPTTVIAPAVVINNYKRLLLGYPVGAELEANSVMAAQRTFRVRPGGAHHLRFYISVTAATEGSFEDKEDWNDKKLECLVAVNGAIVAREKLSEMQDGNAYVSLTQDNGLAFTPLMTLQFIIRNVSPIESVGARRCPVAALEYIDLQ